MTFFLVTTMSKKSGADKRKETNDHEENTDEREEIVNEKGKLLDEIKALRLLIHRIENSFTPMSFKNISKQEMDISIAGREKFGHLVDVEVESRNDLYAYAGLCCKKIDEEIVFGFESCEKNFNATNHWIQLAKVAEHWELRQWVMPMSIDVRKVIAKYLIDSAGSMKLFLQECKHLVDCYNHRENEFRELKLFSESLASGFSVDSNYGYTQMTMKLALKARPASPDQGRNVFVRLVYGAREARPSRLLIDGDGESEFSADETRNFRAIFRSLKDRDLNDAVKEILESEENPFAVTDSTESNSVNDTIQTEDGEEEENSLTMILKTKSKPARKREKRDDGRENDLSFEAAETSKVQHSEENAKRTKTVRKSPKKKTSRKSKASAKGRKSLPLEDRNDNESNMNSVVKQNEQLHLPSKNDKEIRSTVPEMFRPKNKETRGNSAENKLANPPGVSRTRSKIANSVGESSVNAGNSAANSVKRTREQLKCSTPIVGRTLLLSAVTGENISAIDRENDDNPDGSDSDETRIEDATRIENGQRELLKQLRAVREKKDAPKKPAKRKAKSPAAKGIKKIARK